ncbi:hypothetical protein N7501_007412 [Penicillium viridicatum]|nr:hypothetical protein N7501_007412 [Penicillium viridicatum]
MIASYPCVLENSSDTSLTEPLQDYIKRHNVSPVVKACTTGNQEMVLWLTNHNPSLGTLEDRDLDGQTAIFRAVEGLKEVGTLMLQAQYEGNGALPRRKLEQRWGRMEPFIGWLLDMNCPMEVMRGEVTKLDEIFCKYCAALSDQLLQQLDVNEKDDRGCTALHYLVKNFDQADAVRHLLSQGADVNAVDQEANTPLHEVMKGTMLRRQDDQDNPVDLEQLPTHLKNTQDAMIQILLTSGASEGILNGKGETPRQVQSRVLEERARRLAAQQVARGRGRGRAVR